MSCRFDADGAGRDAKMRRRANLIQRKATGSRLCLTGITRRTLERGHQMSKATILYLVDVETPDAEITQAAEKADQAGHYLRCILASTVPVLPFSVTSGVSFGAATGADHWHQLVAEEQVVLNTRTQEIEGLLAKTGVSGDISSVFCVSSEVKPTVATFARTSDMMCVAPSLRDDPDLFAGFVQAALFEAPIGVLINSPPIGPVDHVFLAWDDGNAAANAAHKALPMLKQAGKVTIGCFDPITDERGSEAEPGADLAAWLTRHGCTVTVAQYPSCPSPLKLGH
jgi:hypothetical protein